MKLDGKISSKELFLLIEQLVPHIQDTYLKKIYHWEGKWMFRFSSDLNVVFEPGISIWPGHFIERESTIHSVCVKLRKEILDCKIKNIYRYIDDRKIVFEFYNGFFLVLEIFAKGNLILLNKEQQIIVYTRTNKFTNHGKDYYISKSSENKNLISKGIWTKLDYQIDICETGSLDWWILMKKMWEIKNTRKKSKPEKPNKEDNIQREMIKWLSSLHSLQNEIKEQESLIDIDYIFLSQLHEKRKTVEKKLDSCKNLQNSRLIVHKNRAKKNLIPLDDKKWYHEYYWWYTQDKKLVVGGKNADQNEKLVKARMKPFDIFFHSEDPGSGVFLIIKIEETDVIQEKDMYDVATGVLSFSQNWKSNRNGNAFWVIGKQVTKTPPSGEYLSKGSFMIHGQKNFIRVDTLVLGYTIYENQLLLAPYSVIQRQKKKP